MQQSNSGDINVQGSIQAETVVLGHQNNTTINYQCFPDWEALQREQSELVAQYQQHPNVAYFAQHLQEVHQKIESFQQEVLKLAEDFKRIPLNTQRLRDAYDAFEQGDLQTVRFLLREPEVEQEKDALLQRRAQLANQTDENEAKLTDKANEFILLARATALDFSLGEERIPQTCAAYEQALECQRSPEHLFSYAYFLQDENQRAQAQVHYEEALALYRQLAHQQPTVYELEVAGMLNNLANLLAEDASQRALAHEYYEEALALHRRLASQQPAVYESEVASSLNNLAILLADDASQRTLAQQYHEEALALRRRLAGQQPAVYEPKVASSLNNLAALLANDASQRTLAQGYYEESLALYRRLAHQQPAVYEPDMAMSLNNLANLLAKDASQRTLAQGYYEESLALYRRLAGQQPAVYEPDVATSLNNLANLLADDASQRTLAQGYYEESLALYRRLAGQQPNLYSQGLVNALGAQGGTYLLWNDPQSALTYLEEALQLLHPLYELHPNIYGAKYEDVQTLLAYCRQQLQPKPKSLFARLLDYFR